MTAPSRPPLNVAPLPLRLIRAYEKGRAAWVDHRGHWKRNSQLAMLNALSDEPVPTRLTPAAAEAYHLAWGEECPRAWFSELGLEVRSRGTTEEDVLMALVARGSMSERAAGEAGCVAGAMAAQVRGTAPALPLRARLLLEDVVRAGHGGLGLLCRARKN